MKVFTSNRLLVALSVVILAMVVLTVAAPNLAPSVMDILGEDARRALGRPYFKLGNVAITPVLFIKLIVCILALTFASRLARRFIRLRVLARTSMDEGQRYAAERIAGYAIVLIGSMVMLQSLGVNLSSLAFLGGIIGVGIGFGLQTIANNFVSGLILLTERPIKIGDRVEVAGMAGVVLRIGARSTWVRGADNGVMILPNSELVTGRVLNLSAIEHRLRLVLKVGVSYGADPDAARVTMIRVALDHPDVLRTPPPEVVLTGFGENGMTFELRVWTMTPGPVPGGLQSDLYLGIHRAFLEKGIEIPLPQRTLHLRSASAPIAVRNEL